MMKVSDNSTKEASTVCFITSYAGCPRVWKMASTLAKKEFRVIMIEWDRSSKLRAKEHRRNMVVYRMKLRAPYGLRLLFKLPTWWIYLSLLTLTIRFTVAQPQNLDNLLASWAICRIKHVKVVYDLADFYSDAYVSNSQLLKKIVRWLERSLIRTLDGLILVSEGQISQVERRNLPKRFIFVYNTP